MITLTQEERNKFVSWLKQDATNNDELVQQMEKISLPKNIIDTKKKEIMAEMIVANMLENTESQEFS
jgi:hypothetical protein